MTKKGREQRPWSERDDLLLRLMLEMHYPAYEVEEALERELSAIKIYARKMGYKMHRL